MHLGAVTFNVLKDWDLETIIEKLGEIGYEAVELRTGHKHGVEPSLGQAEREQVRRRFEAGKVRLLSYGTACDLHSPDDQERAAAVAVAKQFIDLARDTGALGVKVRPNGLPEGVPREVTIGSIAGALRELGDYSGPKGIEIWLEVHGRGTNHYAVIAEIMKAAKHDAVGVCWNSDSLDIVDGSVRQSFDTLRPWLKSAHIHELYGDYPYREFFRLLRKSGYDRYTLIEAGESCEPERFLRYYRALWMELASKESPSPPS